MTEFTTGIYESAKRIIGHSSLTLALIFLLVI